MKVKRKVCFVVALSFPALGSGSKYLRVRNTCAGCGWGASLERNLPVLKVPSIMGTQYLKRVQRPLVLYNSPFIQFKIQIQAITYRV